MFHRNGQRLDYPSVASDTRQSYFIYRTDKGKPGFAVTWSFASNRNLSRRVMEKPDCC